jgi:hypothetical protein
MSWRWWYGGIRISGLPLAYSQGHYIHQLNTCGRAGWHWQLPATFSGACSTAGSPVRCVAAP